MCMAVPMKIIEISDGDIGKVEANEVIYNVNLSLIKNPRLDDFVLVHAGFAFEKLDKKEANTRMDLFKKLSEIDTCSIKSE